LQLNAIKYLYKLITISTACFVFLKETAPIESIQDPNYYYLLPTDEQYETLLQDQWVVHQDQAYRVESIYERIKEDASW